MNIKYIISFNPQNISVKLSHNICQQNTEPTKDLNELPEVVWIISTKVGNQTYSVIFQPPFPQHYNTLNKKDLEIFIYESSVSG